MKSLDDGTREFHNISNDLETDDMNNAGEELSGKLNGEESPFESIQQSGPGDDNGGRNGLVDDDMPEDGFTPGNNKGKKNGKRKGLKRPVVIVLLSLLVVLCAMGAGVFFYFRNAMLNPQTQFTQTPSVSSSLESLLSQADQSLLNDSGIRNILLVGVDYASERETWNGKHAYHADVMMVLAVNFNKKTVDMISLPRDTYANIPGVQGIYKLNASMDCGGGFPVGFSKVAEAASWMLGGIPIYAYYGVSMPVVKDLVDAIGGVTFDIDVAFTMDGRPYQTGVQHLNGQGVLDYCRVRKNLGDESGDVNRVIRQKKMLIAVFKTMQEQNLWTRLPSILSAFNGKLFTNATLGQTAALAYFAYNLKEQNITIRTIGGRMASVFNWNFCITDQAKRVQTIKEVYGITVPQYAAYGYNAVMKKWGGMMYNVYMPNATTLINYVQALIDNGTVPTPTPTLTPTPTPTPTPTETTSPTPTPDATSSKVKSNTHVSALATTGTVNYEIYQQFLKVKDLLTTAEKLKGGTKNWVDALVSLKTECMTLASMVNSPLKSINAWQVVYQNQIEVDFR